MKFPILLLSFVGLQSKLLTADAFAPHLPRKDVVAPSTVRNRPTQQHRRLHRVSKPFTTLQMEQPNDNSNSQIISGISKMKLLLPITAIVSLSITTLAAYNQLLPGPLIDATSPPPFFATLPFGSMFAGSYNAYTPQLILRDASATIFSIVAAAGFVKAITYPVKLDKLEPRDARKIIHTLSAPLFILVWPLFSNAYGARVFATIVPLLNAVRLLVAGAGSGTISGLNDTATAAAAGEGQAEGSEMELATAISRSGDAKEALQGPFVYVLALLFTTFFFWTDSPIGIVSMATLAVGDGLADLIGRRLGSANKWSFNQSKSVAGSAAFVIGSVVGSFGLISWLISNGTMDSLQFDTLELLGRLFIIAVVSAGVELVPIVDDNYSVPITAAVLSTVLLN
ncbi:predicted protein [Thalassiosira pseudonana CCMP1335]|uniref:phytol kinase n=1 Tax=Thalassiosira pseudonana TaxID=35128 RepID=B8C1G2_THAPS|nr:predicted protein [Thalassiosira pseudonana CCMP1335]EED93238.1 predicted protein [Thalassiosira pseudonana CCMP1335]